MKLKFQGHDCGIEFVNQTEELVIDRVLKFGKQRRDGRVVAAFRKLAKDRATSQVAEDDLTEEPTLAIH